MPFSKLQKSARRDKCFKSWNICMSHCDDHRKQKYECYFFWNISNILKFETLKSMDIWTEYSNIRIYGGKISTYKCAPNQEHTNQWFNVWNIVTHRYMAQLLEHMHAQ